MKLRYKILTGIGGVLVLAIATLMTVTAWDSPCPVPSLATPGPGSMRAATFQCYGVSNLHVQFAAKPVPREGQVLIKVHASSVNPAEWYGVSGQPYLVRLDAGIGKPKDTRAGFDMAGVVESVGPDVTRFKPGDEVFGGAADAFADYALGRDQGGIALKPAKLSFEEAAAMPIAAITALQGLRDNGHIAPGQKVLINGASGGVGTYAVQIAKALGAEVTGVCSSRNMEMVRSLGADHVIDYTRDDFTAGSEKYDLILDNVGNHGYLALARVTTTNGYIVSVGGSKVNPWLGPISRVIVARPIAGLFLDQHLPFYIARIKKDDMEFLAQLASEGKLRTVIDRRYPLEQVSAALEYLGTGHARGKVVVTID
ncbi:MAG TPA: NAD(P)-dependent alcohol dehydrogenase [Steroidobacteraceae bacterium]|nr:NAD(P)-dependent alcohol dehydrogenase [Steroidobacteraceae bacterium]